MEDLSTSTSELKDRLIHLSEHKDKEHAVFKYIESAEKSNCAIDDFPSNLDWFNTTKALTGAHLYGKIVLLDFFTYCCINCLHIIPHLRQLEENFSVADGLVVIGVHSAKFENEKDSQNILLALRRYNISHPVVNDHNCYMWNKLGISCWPTIVILGPHRKPLFALIGEGHRDELLLFVKVALKFYKNSISPHQLPIVPCDQIITSSLFSFPGKITRWKNLYAVSDSGNHRIVIFDGDTNYIRFTVGGKNPGFKDGTFETARFNSPQGLVFYNGDTIYVADTENHAVRLISLEKRQVTTVVGNGEQGTDYVGGRVGKQQEISSPWDVCIVPCSDVEVAVARNFPFGVPLAPVEVPPLPPVLPGTPTPPPPPPPPVFVSNRPPVTSPPSGKFPPPPVPPLVPPSLSAPLGDAEKPNSSKVLLIAAAGTHQIWAYFIESCTWWKGQKYEENVCLAIAGNGKEENRNNRYPMMASFAQPSGLTYSKELKSVFIADSESSSVRKLSLKDGCISHVTGGGRSPNDLFSYGDVDGKAHDAKLQHPLAVAWSSKRNCLFVCDTYNHKVKRVNVSPGECKSLHKTREFFSEPSGACLDESENFIYVCDTNNNCIKRVNVLDGSVTELKIQENEDKVLENPVNDIWETETSLGKTGGHLSIKITFSPEEIHGKWRIETNESSKLKATITKGKLNTNVAELDFIAFPSGVDDVLDIFFDLVLCGNDICSFKKLRLRVYVKRVENGKELYVCELKKNLV